MSQEQLPWSGQPSDNLTTLTQLTEHTLLTALQTRYQDNSIYTDVGDILIAVNPFKLLPLYSEEWSHAYSRIDVNSLAPHIFKVASRAYNAMVSDRKDQVCVISGESGAGKTESAKFIMHQVSYLSSHTQVIFPIHRLILIFFNNVRCANVCLLILSLCLV